MNRRIVNKEHGSSRTVVVSDGPGDGWCVSVTPADRPPEQDLWFARRDCAQAFASGMCAAIPTWRVADESTARTPGVERAKAEALAQLDLFIAGNRGP